MLSIEECKKYLDNSDLSNEEVEELRNLIYSISENLLTEYIKDEQPNITKSNE